MNDYLGQHKKLVRISELNNYFRNDPTQNIKIAVLDSDDEIKNMIHHLISQRLLLPSAVFGIPFSAIAIYFSIKSKMETTRNKTRRLYYEDDLSYHINCDDLMTQIEAHDGGLSAFKSYFWQFPIQVYDVDMYRYYDSSNGHQNDRNWEFAKSHESALRTKYNSSLLEMKELGLIPTRWVNELSLYFFIRSYFSDAIYQYRCDWLGLQSLDIYIPSQRVGIEYQGKQHYKAVEFFGGEQALEDTRKRDARKRLLCRENKVQLLVWHYSVDVQPNTVYEFLLTSGIWRPKELKRRDASVPTAVKKSKLSN